MGSAFGSASGAAKAQTDAANKGLALQKQMYDQTRADNMPFLTAGTAGVNELAIRLGLAPTTGVGDFHFSTPEAQALYQQTLAGKGNINGLNKRYGTTGNEGVQKHVAALTGAKWIQDQQDNTGNENYGSLLKSYAESGQKPTDDPGYQFRFDEGMKALERSQAARSGLLSGAALKASQTYGQGLGSQEYMNSYNRYNIDQGNVYNRLAGISGTGQQAVNTAANAGQNYAQGATSLYNSIGNAQAAAKSSGWGTGLLNAGVKLGSAYLGGL